MVNANTARYNEPHALISPWSSTLSVKGEDQCGKELKGLQEKYDQDEKNHFDHLHKPLEYCAPTPSEEQEKSFVSTGLSGDQYRHDGDYMPIDYVEPHDKNSRRLQSVRVYRKSNGCESHFLSSNALHKHLEKGCAPASPAGGLGTGSVYPVNETKYPNGLEDLSAIPENSNLPCVFTTAPLSEPGIQGIHT
ncbi:hypothetical protein J1614_012217 [Plenodomus biglobosus]|nr:hypothetical protein J1614_012217 [Plenodomus biglobosus]